MYYCDATEVADFKEIPISYLLDVSAFVQQDVCVKIKLDLAASQLNIYKCLNKYK
jgi:hypothetical protein